MKCLKCKGQMQDGYTTYVADLGRCVVVVRRVPCVKCEECGEVVYTGTVMATLERLIETLKDVFTEVAIINYPEAA